MRRPLVAANWKMNLNLPQARKLVADVRDGLVARDERALRIEVAICPPAVYLFPMAKALEGSGIALGAQNVFYELEGAFTGELAPGMLAETGVRYVLIGHSERRHVLSPGEDDWTLNRKVHAALRVGLVPVLCVGETLDQRQADQTDDVLAFQVAAGLSGTRISGGGQLVIAYEPVWAIGTGQNATPEQAQNAHARIRALLKQRLGAAGEEVRILYGGSLKPDNARVILAQPDVDGGLVGGASLKAESFLGILAAAMEA